MKVAATLALNRGHRALLESLGGKVPEAWRKEERRLGAAAEGELDGRDLLPGVDSDSEEGEELGEDALFSLAMELQDDFGDAQRDADSLRQEERREDARKGRYGLREAEASAALVEHMRRYEEWRSAVLCGSRRGRRVQEATVATDRATLLRYLGWLRALLSGESLLSGDFS